MCPEYRFDYEKARPNRFVDSERRPRRRTDMQKSSFTAILEREGDLFVALCPELDVASQGPTVEEATANLREAVELFLECADPSEIDARQHKEVFVTRFEAAHG
jgi:DNA phosphorothioation-dependent restriction protein DptG